MREWRVECGEWSYGVPFGDDFKFVAKRLLHFTLHSPLFTLYQISRFTTYFAFCSIHSRLGSTSSPMRTVKTSSA